MRNGTDLLFGFDGDEIYSDSTESLETPEFNDDDGGMELGTFGCWGDDSPRAIATALLCAVGLIAAALSVALFVEWLLR